MLSGFIDRDNSPHKILKKNKKTKKKKKTLKEKFFDIPLGK
jgi:hypothetical protein